MKIKGYIPLCHIKFTLKKEHNITSRHKHHKYTTTIYFVQYLANDGSKYKYQYEVGSAKSIADEILEKKEPIDRKVLSIIGEHKHLTIEANETAQSYEAQQKLSYLKRIGGSVAYILLWSVGTIILYKRRKKRKETLGVES